MSEHTHTPIPEYKETLTTAGHSAVFVNEIIEGLEYSSIIENCPACQTNQDSNKKGGE